MEGTGGADLRAMLASNAALGRKLDALDKSIAAVDTDTQQIKYELA
jgi:hypothetical protein